MSIPEIIDWNLKNIFSNFEIWNSKWAPNKTNRILFHKNNLDETKKIPKKLHPAHEHEPRWAQVRLLGSFPKPLVQYLSWVEKQLWWLRCKLFWVVLWRCVMTNSLLKTISSCYLSCFNQNDQIWDPNRVLPHFFDTKTAKISLIQPEK